MQTIDLRNASTQHPVKGPGVAPMQRILGVVPADGVAGDVTRRTLGAFQTRVFGRADYIFGQQTAEALLAGK